MRAYLESLKCDNVSSAWGAAASRFGGGGSRARSPFTCPFAVLRTAWRQNAPLSSPTTSVNAQTRRSFASNRPLPPHSDKWRSRGASTDLPDAPQEPSQALTSPRARRDAPLPTWAKALPIDYLAALGLPSKAQGCLRIAGLPHAAAAPQPNARHTQKRSCPLHTKQAKPRPCAAPPPPSARPSA